MHCSTTPASRRYLAPPSAISVKATCVSVLPTQSRTSTRRSIGWPRGRKRICSRFIGSAVTNESPESKAPPVGRALRGLFGILLMAYVTPVYFRIPLRTSLSVVLLIIGLIGIYSLIHVFISRRIIGFGPRLGAFMAVGLLVVLCVLCWPPGAILCPGAGGLGGGAFLGLWVFVA